VFLTTVATAQLTGSSGLNDVVELLVRTDCLLIFPDHCGKFVLMPINDYTFRN
jgi:hypothetical protein